MNHVNVMAQTSRCVIFHTGLLFSPRTKMQDFQGRNWNSSALKKLHVQYTSYTYRTQTSIRFGTSFLLVRNYILYRYVSIFPSFKSLYTEMVSTWLFCWMVVEERSSNVSRHSHIQIGVRKVQVGVKNKNNY